MQIKERGFPNLFSPKPTEDEKTRHGVGYWIERRSNRTKPPQAWAQCEVPSERVILFQTLYLPTGLLIGSRLTSLSVCAS